MKHNAMDIYTAVQISVTAQEVRVTPLVRVPDFQHFHASRVLGGEKLGVVVPHVDIKEIAQKIVDQCKYPPIGHRSVTVAQPMLDFQIYPMGEATQAVNPATCLVIILKTPLVIFNVHEIAAIPAWMHC
jgi:2-keto-3-deoxy-L-rhamnonate aldolase RhmA